jgi:hypothetical protein
MRDAVEKADRSLDAFYGIKGHDRLGHVVFILSSPGGVEIKKGASIILHTQIGIRFQYHGLPRLFFR